VGEKGNQHTDKIVERGRGSGEKQPLRRAAMLKKMLT